MKDFIKWCLLFFSMIIIAFVVNLSFEKVKEKKVAKEKVDILPSLQLLKQDSSQVNVLTLLDKTLILIYFNSECDLCHNEARAIKRNDSQFSQVNIVFVSTESLNNIRDFVNKHELTLYNNIFFLQVDQDQLSTKMGALGTPHIFIYGTDRKLKTQFRGETTGELILKNLSDNE